MAQDAGPSKLQELKVKYDKTKEDKIKLVGQLIRSLQEHPSEERLREFRAAVHNIGGSAGSYGYSFVSKLCKEIDSQARAMLEPWKGLGKDWLSSLDKFLDEMIIGFNEESSKDAQLHELRTFVKHPLIYIIDSDQQFLSLLEQIKDQFLMDVNIETDPKKALERLQDPNFKPDCVAVSQRFHHSPITAEDFIDVVKDKMEQHPTLFVLLIEDESMRQRLEAAQGCFHYVIKKPVSGYVFFKLMKDALNHNTAKGFRVLILDDDLDFCEFVTGVLSEENISVNIINHPEDLFSTLEEFKPHVLLLDLVLPKYDGLKLLRALRQDAVYNHLIIIVVTSSEEEDTRLDAYSAKADDILYKPIDPELLKKRILYLAERYALVGNVQQIVPKAEKAVIQPDLKGAEEIIATPGISRETSKKNREVFLIDPDEGLIKILKAAFEARGVKVRSFKEGGEALAELFKEARKDRPALIVAERKLPDMDGLDLYKKLQTGLEKMIPMYFLTIFSSDKDVAQGLSLGVDEYIGKPFNLSIFMQKALKTIDSQG